MDFTFSLPYFSHRNNHPKLTVLLRNYLRRMESELENKLINSYKNEMISFLQTHPEYFNEALNLAVGNKQPYSWRAAFLLWACMEENDKRVRRHIKSIVESIKTKKDGHQRELLKILDKMDLKESYEGMVFDQCMNIWEAVGKAPSVRFTALKFIMKTAKKYPEILKEITFLTQDHYLESLSPGIKNAVERMMEEFEK